MSLQTRGQDPLLEVTGLVEEPIRFGLADLGGVEGLIGDVGDHAEGFVGEAVPVAEVLRRAQPLPAAEFVTAVSDDGHYRASIPLSEVERSGWLAFRLGGEPIPRRLGGPVRLIVPQGRTLCWNVKSVVLLRVTAEPEPDSVPADPPH